MDLQAILLFPLHLGVLSLLHTVFATLRLVVVVAQLFENSRHQSTRPLATPAKDLADKRWTKVPRHLAVVLAPSKWSRRGGEEKQVMRLIEWCRQLGIPQLTVYDREGASPATHGCCTELTSPRVKVYSCRTPRRSLSSTRNGRCS
jgi:hypothetical protein